MPELELLCRPAHAATIGMPEQRPLRGRTFPKTRAVLYPIQQPADVEIDEVVLRPTMQDF